MKLFLDFDRPDRGGIVLLSMGPDDIHLLDSDAQAVSVIQARLPFPCMQYISTSSMSILLLIRIEAEYKDRPTKLSHLSILC